MKFRNTLYFFATIVFLTLSSFSVNALAQTAEEKPHDLMTLVTGNSVEGLWTFNDEESDDVERKIQSLIRRSFSYSDGSLSAEKTEIPGMSISIIPPERLVLMGGKDEMTVNEFYIDVISTRSLRTDGKIHFYQANSNANVAVSAIVETRKLSIISLSPRGNHMIETFELSANGSKLRVSINISNANFEEILTLQRIYDRALLEDLSDYN